MHPWRARRRALLRAAAVGVGVSVPVFVLAYLVRAGAPGLQHADESVVFAATTFTREHEPLRDVLIAWQEVFHPRWVNIAGVAVCAWVWRRHALPGRAVWAAGTLLASWGLTNLLKAVIDRARPVVDDALVHAPGGSFPSGHATASAVAGVTLTVLLWPLLGARARVLVPGLAAVLVVTTCADRVLLGAHFPSDVVGGLLLGAAMAGASAVGYLGLASSSPVPDPVAEERP